MAAPQLSLGGSDKVHRASLVYQNAFKNDPAIKYVLPSLSDASRHAYLYTYFTRLMTAAALNNGIFTSAGDWSSCTVIIPPGSRVDNPWTLVPSGLLGLILQGGLRCAYRMLFEFGSLSDAAKAKGLKGQKKYHYLFFVGTKHESRGRGLSSALIRQAQEQASKDGLPMWLEATTEYSFNLYAKLGFELVEKFLLGKDIADPDGSMKQGGTGVPIYAMIWWPPCKA